MDRQLQPFDSGTIAGFASGRSKCAWLTVVLAGAMGASAAAQCEFAPLPGLHTPGTDGRITALTFADLGRGPRLIVGGQFDTLGARLADKLASWDGRQWELLEFPFVAGYPGHSIQVVTSFDPDGPGPASNRLIVGGILRDSDGPENIVAWDGSAWSPLGGGIHEGEVTSLAVLDPDGPGPASPRLIVGGSFGRAGEIDARRIASWDGAAWSALGEGLPRVDAIATYAPPGREQRVYAAGFDTLYEWDGAVWRTIGQSSGAVTALQSAEPVGAHGPELYAAGFLTSIDGTPVHRIAAWDGELWRDAGDSRFESAIATQVVHQAGGPMVFAVATVASDEPWLASVGVLARQDGEAWTVVANAPRPAKCTAGSTVAPNSALGGLFVAGWDPIDPDTTNAQSVARFDGTTYQALGGGRGAVIPGRASWFPFTFDPTGDGSQPRLFLAGRSGNFGGIAAAGLVTWDGARWIAIDNSGVDGSVFAAQAFDDGAGPAVCLAGLFSEFGGAPARNIVRWDGTAFSPLGAGMNMPVFALTVFDDGGGPALYAGGDFYDADNDPNSPESHVARWNGARWEGLVGGQLSGTLSYVRSMTVFDLPDDSQPPLLVVGGSFERAGIRNARNVAAWNGTTWSRLGDGVPLNVHSLAAFDDGTGMALYAAAAAAPIGSSVALWRWNGLAWSDFGSAARSGDGRALCVVDEDGGGPRPARLFAGGGEHLNLVEWTGAAWVQSDIVLPASSSEPVRYLAAVQAASHGELWASLEDGRVAALAPLGPSGDIDRDGATGLGDLVILLSHFGESATTFFDGDLNGDDVVDLQDLAILLAHFGADCGP